MADHCWSIEKHNLFGFNTNIILSTFFLCVQRLENENIIPLAHQAMFEDMLELLKSSDFYRKVMNNIIKIY